MGSLVPTFSYTPNATAASNAYIAAQNKFSDSLMDPIELLSKLNNEAIAAKEREEEKAIRAEDRAWKLEDRARAAKERQAEDAYYGELARGVQTKGGIYGDALATESNKYDLTPDEILKATLYKNDAEQARAAGETVLADKLAWQTKVSDNVDSFMQSGVGEESRVEMYDRINSMVAGKGLPIPKEAILSADQARLDKKTAEENEAKRLKEAKAEILKNDQANAWKLVNALGNTRTEIDEDGNEVQVVGSRAGTSGSKDNSFNKSIDGGLTDVLKAIEEKTKGTENTTKAVTSEQAIKLYNTLVGEEGISADVASNIVSMGIGSTQPGWKELWLGDPKAKLSKDQLSFILPAAKEAMALKKNTASTTGSGVSTKAAEAAKLYQNLEEESLLSLKSILSEQAKLARGAEGRRADSVNAWLQDRGLLAKSKVEENAEQALGATGKPLEAKVNKNIKSIAGIPDSMVASEGVTNTSYKDGNGYSIAMGYNLHYNKDDITKDFKDANISPEKAFIAKTRPQDLVLDDGEAQRLSQVAYYKYADSLDKKLGGTLDKLSPQMQATALQMHYRGDLFKDADYAKELRKYVKADDYDGLVKYVSENAATLPAPVVRRLENDLRAPVTSNLRGTMSNEDKIAYLEKALSGKSKPVKELFGGSDVIDAYASKKKEQEKELSSSAYARTFGPKTEAGKYAKVWEESDSKKGSSLSKNISSLATAMKKDGISTFEEVATLYNSMPEGPDKDAVGEVLNYKGMQNSQDWRDAKDKEQYLEAGLTALTALPGLGNGIKNIIAQPLKNAIRDKAEAAVIKKVLLDPTLAGTARKEAAKSVINSTKVKQEQIKGFINSSSKELENIRKQILATKKPSKDLIRQQDELADYISRAKRELAEIDTDLSTLLNAAK